MSRTLRTGAICTVVALLSLAACSGDTSPAPSALASASTIQGGSATPEASQTPTSPAAATPSAEVKERTPSANCVNPPVDIRDLIYQTDPLACYRGADLTFDGTAAGLGATDCLQGLEPAWFECEQLVELRPIESAGSPSFLLAAHGLSGPSMTAALRPDSGYVVSSIPDGPLRMTGHYDDPAAQTCHYTGAAAGAPEADSIVPGCRATFVIVGLEASGP